MVVKSICTVLNQIKSHKPIISLNSGFLCVSFISFDNKPPTKSCIKIPDQLRKLVLIVGPSFLLFFVTSLSEIVVCIFVQLVSLSAFCPHLLPAIFHFLVFISHLQSIGYHSLLCLQLLLLLLLLLLFSFVFLVYTFGLYLLSSPKKKKTQIGNDRNSYCDYNKSVSPRVLLIGF